MSRNTEESRCPLCRVWFILLSFSVLGMCVPASFRAQTLPPGERAALIALYNSTGGPNWVHQDNWLGPEGTENTWYGVSVDPNTWTVSSVNLQGNGLDGTLPPEIGDFTNISMLNLSDNTLRGPIPPEVGALWSLSVLDLQHNELSGPIPPELAGLHYCNTLDLSYNQLSGTIPAELADAPHLNWIELEVNHLWGEVPRHFCEIGRYITVHMAWNALHAEDPALVAYLRENVPRPPGLQAVPPPHLAADPTGPSSVLLTWTPIRFYYSGGYRIYRADKPEGPYIELADLPDPTSSLDSYRVEGLAAGTANYFEVRSYLNASGMYDHPVESEPGLWVEAVAGGELSIAAQSSDDLAQAPGDIAFTAVTNGGMAPVSIAWDFGDGASADGNPGATHSFTVPGNYRYTVKATDATGATAMASGALTIYPAPSVEAYSTPDLSEGRYLFVSDAKDGYPPYSYNWDFGDGTHSTDPNSLVYHSYGDPGIYPWHLTITDSRDSTASAQGVVRYASPLSVAATASPAWGTVPLAAHFEAHPSNGYPPYEYTWDFGDGSPLGNQPEMDHVYSQAWPWTWRLLVRDSRGETVTASGTVLAGVPQITGIAIKNSPSYMLLVSGNGFSQDCSILIDGQPVPKSVYKSGTLMKAKGGNSLKRMLSQASTVYVQVLAAGIGVPSPSFELTTSELALLPGARPKAGTRCQSARVK